MASSEGVVPNGEVNGRAPLSATTKRTLEEAAAAQMAQLDLEGNKLPTPASSKSKLNGSGSANGVREGSGKTSARPSTRSSSTNVTASSRASSTARSASSSRKSSQQNVSVSPTSATAPEIKKLPMNKIVVGTAPSPNVAKVSSKIGSLQNASYKPTGGNVKIENKKLNWEVKSKIGSMDNVKHRPGGGNVKIENQKIDVKVQSKIGSLQNVKHRPGGGDKKIFDDKEYLRQQKQVSGSASSKPGSSKGGSMKGSQENLMD